MDGDNTDIQLYNVTIIQLRPILLTRKNITPVVTPNKACTYIPMRRQFSKRFSFAIISIVSLKCNPHNTHNPYIKKYTAIYALQLRDSIRCRTSISAHKNNISRTWSNISILERPTQWIRIENPLSCFECKI